MKAARYGCANILAGLTHSLDNGKEGLAMHATRLKNCANCGGPFNSPSGRGGNNQRFCCAKCRYDFKNKNRINPTTITCEECGTPRTVKHPAKAGRMCRACAAKIGTIAARKANTQPIEERFMRYVQKAASGCWEWTGRLQKNGYSTFYCNGKIVRGHRWSYEHFIAPIPQGKEIDHLCRNRKCVNPAHLEPVTRKENRRRAMRSHCVNGHAFTPENIYMHDGKRYCREYRRIRVRAYQRRKANAKKQSLSKESRSTI